MTSPPSDEDIARFRRIDGLFDQVLDQPTGQRESWIDAATVDEPELRARLLEMHRAHQRANGFLEQPAAERRDGTDVRARLAEAVRGRYRVDGPLGRGGMASVFLALDARHARPVAIKVLGADVRSTLGGRGAERFLGEIRTLAQLQHPNIVPLYDSGDHDGLLYFVMPFVAGPSLRRRLEDGGPFDVAEAVRIACVVADALGYAHARGIVHRDLKPENVLLHEAQPLISDFGIALALARAGEADPADAGDPGRLTGTGTLLGTPRYMAPEQAAGEQFVDHRADIHALGAILYELLTGDPPYLSGSVQGTFAKIRTERPLSVDAVRDGVPPGVVRAIDRALAKVPADRFQAAADFAAALRAGLGGDVDAVVSPAAGTRLSERARGVRAAGRTRWGQRLLLVAAGIGAGTWMTDARVSDTGATSAPLLLEVVTTPPIGRRASLHMAHDGALLVYGGDAASGGGLFTRSPLALSTHRLEGTADAVHSAISADGHWVAYTTASDQLMLVSSTGGPVSQIGGIFRLDRLTWVGSEAIVADGYGFRGLAWIPARSGTWRMLTRLDSAGGESQHTAPHAVGGGKTVLFVVWRRRAGPDGFGGELAVTTLDPAADGPRPHRLLGVSAAFIVGVLGDWVLYASADRSKVFASRFDAERRRFEGSPQLVFEPDGGGLQRAELADDGTLTYVTAPLGYRVVRDSVSARGASYSIGPLRGAMHPRVSPDGRRMVLQERGPAGFGIVVRDLLTGDSTRITTPDAALQPVFTPDGRSIVYLSTTDGDTFWRVPVSGGEPVRVVTAAGAFSPAPSADGGTLYFQRRLDGRWQIWGAPLGAGTADGAEGRAVEAVVDGPSDAAFPAPSPDGRWLAWATNESGRYELALAPLDRPGSPRRLTSAGGTEPVWSRDGRSLYFRRGDLIRRLVFAADGSGPFADELVARHLLEEPLPARHFDVLPDGSIVMTVPLDPSPPRAFAVMGWAPHVRARLAR